MTSVDSRVVTMKFDNAAFEKGVSTTMASLQKLSGLVTGMPAINKVFSGVQGAATGLNNSLPGIETSTGRISAGFAAMATVAITALSNITNKVVDTGLNMVKSLSVGPVMDGFDEYELKMGSIQTILANTAQHGTKLEDVEHALEKLNEYSDKTIYNFGQMTKNIGLFTNAGIKLEDATSMIKGFSNAAAASGTSAEGAASAAYQLSQAMSAGTVRLMDWRSLQNVGMGGENMKNGIIDIADAMGTLEANSISATEVSKDFNGSLEKNWLSADVMSTYLKIMAGDMNKAEMASLGLTDAQIKMFQQQQKTAEEAATKVRTFSQLMNTIKESIASGWSETFAIIFGDFNEATKLFTGINDAIGGFVGSMSKARNALLADWAEMGGRALIIDALRVAFNALYRVLLPIRNAFRDVFPPATAEGLMRLTEGFHSFTKSLIANRETMANIRSIFRALFTVLAVGIEIVKGVFRYFFEFIGLLSGGTGGILDFVAAIADIITKLGEWILQGDYIAKFFDTIIAGREAVLAPIIAALSGLMSILADIVSSGADEFFDILGASWKILSPILGAVADALGWVIDKFAELISGLNIEGALASAANSLENIGEVVANLFDNVDVSGGLSGVGGAFAALGGIISGAISNIDFSSGFSGILDGFKAMFSDIGAFLADLDLGNLFSFGEAAESAEAGVNNVSGALEKSTGILDVFKAAWNGVVDIFSNIGASLSKLAGGVKSNLSSVMDSVSGAFGDSSLELQDILGLINTAFFAALVLTIRSYVKTASRFIDSISGTFEGVSDVLNQVTSNLKTMQNDVRANMILKIAVAIALLAAALYVLSKIDAAKLGISLGAVGALLGMMLIAVKSMTSMAGADMKEALLGAVNMTIISVALMALGAALLLFAGAVAIFGNMDTDTLLKGIGSVAATLVVIIGASKALAASGGAVQMLALSVAIGILAFSLTAFAGALKLYAQMDTGTIIEGGIKTAAVLAGIGFAMRAFPPGMLGTAAAVLALSVSLTLMAHALEEMGGLSLWDIAKSLIAIGGAMVILSLGMKSMAKSSAGVPALLAAAGALLVMAVAMKILAGIGLEGVLIALAGMAGVFIILGLAVAAIAATGGVAIPILQGLAIAILLLGVGMAAAGAGMLMFATGLATLVALGGASAIALTGIIIALAQTFPIIMEQFGLGIVAFAKVIKDGAPVLMDALGTALRLMLDEVTKSIPHFGRLLEGLVREGLRVIRSLFPDVIKTGVSLLLSFLRGIRDAIPQIASVVTDIVIAFVNQMGARDRIRRFAEAAINFLVNALNGVADAMDGQGGRIGTAIGRIVTTFVRELGDAIRAAADEIADAISDMLRQAVSDAVVPSLPSIPGLGLAGDIADGLGLIGDNNGESGTAWKTFEGASDVQKSLDGMRNSLVAMNTAVSSNMDVRPKITPVLDLSQVQEESKKIAPMFKDQKMNVSGSYQNAQMVSRAVRERDNEQEEVRPETREIKIEQNNYSPKPLSAADSYRNTKSATALAREALSR